jgi:serine/threonine-protein kinase
MARGGFGTLRPGQIVNARYRIEDLVGRGGMSRVVSATDLQTDRRVALKVLHAERAGSPKDVARLVREARATRQLSSPHAARLFDTGAFIEEGVEIPYLVLELVDGVNLATWLRAKGRLDAPTAATIVWQACDAIAEAHAQGLVHRDIKPANLMLMASARGELVTKVLDFGIARECNADESRLTSTGDLVGSPAYMAPEQMRPGSNVDVRADVWTLGVVLFEMVAGRLPFESPSLPDLCLKILLDDPAVPDDVPAELAVIVRRCLAKEPSERFASAREVADALRPLTVPSLKITTTDIELSALEAAVRDRVPSSDGVSFEPPRVSRRAPRAWARAAFVALAVGVLGLAIGHAIFGDEPRPVHYKAARPTVDASTVRPVERAVEAPPMPAQAAPQPAPVATTDAPLHVSKHAPVTVVSGRLHAATVNRAQSPSRVRLPASVAEQEAPSQSLSRAESEPTRDPLASPF